MLSMNALQFFIFDDNIFILVHLPKKENIILFVAWTRLLSIGINTEVVQDTIFIHLLSMVQG